ncbi:MAG TPA: YbaK/EbsC family protein [Acidimicrobiales bacterium]|nr:YbaK/EbsC family protein [Acidimicrobiales bacterium]
MHKNARRVVEAARELGLDIEPQEFDEHTRTAEDAARTIGVTVGQIVKSLVFLVDDLPVLALVSGDNLLDEAKLAAAAGGGEVTRADANKVREVTGYPVGGVPPLGHAQPLRVFVDEDLCRHDVVWAAAGTPHCNFSIAPADLVRATGGAVCQLAR